MCFFKKIGFGSKIYPIPDQKELEEQRRKLSEATDQDENIESSTKSNNGIKLVLEQLTIQLNENVSNKKKAKIKITQLKSILESRDDCVTAKGQLGRMLILDVSEKKGLYSDRLLTCGSKALEFEFIKNQGPLFLNEIKNEFESYLKLRTMSFKYVHSQQFIAWLAKYFQQFNQLQDALGRMRALTNGQKNISFEAQRSSRIKLNINSDAPIILIPLNRRAREVIVFNLGMIHVRNSFGRSNGGCDTSSRECLLDSIDVKFTNTHLYSALLYEYQDDLMKFSTEAEIMSRLNNDEYGTVKLLSCYFK